MIEYRTSVDFCLDAISGKWKVLILNQIEKEAKRISQILTEIPGLTKRVLIRELRELEERILPIPSWVPPLDEFRHPAQYTPCSLLRRQGRFGSKRIPTCETHSRTV